MTLTQISLPSPRIPFCNLPSHGVMIRKVDLAEEVEDCPERLHLRHQRGLHRMDLAQDGERSVALLGQRQRNRAAVERPASTGLPVVGLWGFQTGRLCQEWKLAVDLFFCFDIELRPQEVVWGLGGGPRVSSKCRESQFYFGRCVKHGEMIAPAGAHDDVVSLDGLTRTKDRCVLVDRVDAVSENGDVASMDSGPEVWKGYDPESRVCPEYAAIVRFNVRGENF